MATWSSGATHWQGEWKQQPGQILRVIEGDCSRAIALVNETAGTWCFPPALPDQEGDIYIVVLEVGQDES